MNKEVSPPSPPLLVISFTLTFTPMLTFSTKYLHQAVFKTTPASISWDGHFIDTKIMKMMIYWCKIYFKAMIYQYKITKNMLKLVVLIEKTMKTYSETVILLIENQWTHT